MPFGCRFAWMPVLCFLFGFLTSKGLDMVLELEDLVRLLEAGGIRVSNEYKVNVRAVSSVTNYSSAAASVSSTDVTAAAATVASDNGMKNTTILLDSTTSTLNDTESTTTDMTTTTTTSMTGFDAIVARGYERGLKPVVSTTIERQKFDVSWWMSSSGLTTGGGLNVDDRALVGALYYNATSVFEYGVGESTYIANYVGVPRYSGVDSDPEWIAMAREKVSPHFRFYLGDIGKTKAWGYPVQPRLSKQILDYQLAPLIVEPHPFDIYMVDGRWRVPSMIACFLHASHTGGDPHNTTVLIHDCEMEHNKQLGRRAYKYADHLLRLVNHSGNKLCVYQRRDETTDDQLRDLWFQHMNLMERRTRRSLLLRNDEQQ